MQIQLPAEKALHANCRKLAAYFVFILFLHSFPKHMLGMWYLVLQFDPAQHLLCSCPVSRRASPQLQVMGGVPLLTASSWKQVQYTPPLPQIHPLNLQTLPSHGKNLPILLLIIRSGWGRQGWEWGLVWKGGTVWENFYKAFKQALFWRVMTKNMQAYLWWNFRQDVSCKKYLNCLIISQTE